MAKYRYDRFAAPCLILIALSLLGFAVLCFWAAGYHFLLVIVALMGVLFFLSSILIKATTITVDESGLRSTPQWLGFRVAWDDIEHWFVMRDIDNDLWAHFRVRGRRFAVQIKKDCVAQPGFDAFLEEIRSHVRAKETEPKPWAFGD